MWCRLDAEAFDTGLPTLKVASNIAVGFDNIDVPAARARGVVVTNTPDVLTDAVADFAMGLILDVTRRVTEGDRLVRAGGWTGWALDFMVGPELRGRQLGVVGYGRIGRATARRARAFGMRIAYVPSGEDEAQQVADRDEAVGMPLDELLATSDIVTLHVPLSPATRHMIGARELSLMKRTAYLVNTARGPVVDEAALASALRARTIAGAALDVYEREPVVHPDLLPLENVVLAPHLGSATMETRTAMAMLAARNVVEVLQGRPPLTPIG
jgi:glyoxylate reductase